MTRSAALAATVALTITMATGCSPPTTPTSSATSTTRPATNPAPSPTAGKPRTGPPTTPTTTPVGAAELPVEDPDHNTGQPFPTAGSCHARDVAGGTLPDPTCTPGATDPHVTQASIATTICRPGGYTSNVRPPTSVTSTEKRSALRAYADTAPTSSYELDHLVSLELGGSPNSPHNLWPEPGAAPNPKDKLETALHDLVCAHQMTLTDAQTTIATDWVSAYRQVLGHAPPA